MPLTRRTPCSPSERIARSTAPGDTSPRLRRTSGVILCRPYRPSGVSRRQPSWSTVQANWRTLSSTVASLTVRAATGWHGWLQTR